MHRDVNVGRGAMAPITRGALTQLDVGSGIRRRCALSVLVWLPLVLPRVAAAQTATCAAQQVSPSSGSRSTLVTISGAGLDRSCRVILAHEGGDVFVPPIDRASVSASKLSIYIPAMPAGMSRIVVFPTRSEVIPAVAGLPFQLAFSPATISSVRPASGAPGEIVALDGEGFYTSTTTQLLVEIRPDYGTGWVVTTRPQVISPERLAFTVPFLPSGVTTSRTRIAVSRFSPPEDPNTLYVAGVPKPFQYTSLSAAHHTTSPCAAGTSTAGYAYVGPPVCGSYFPLSSSSLICDGQGYVCCRRLASASSARCGPNQVEEEPDCTDYCRTGIDCAAHLLPQGCYRRTQ